MRGIFLITLLPLPDIRVLLPTPKEKKEWKLIQDTSSIWSFRTNSDFWYQELVQSGFGSISSCPYGTLPYKLPTNVGGTITIRCYDLWQLGRLDCSKWVAQEPEDACTTTLYAIFTN